MLFSFTLGCSLSWNCIVGVHFYLDFLPNQWNWPFKLKGVTLSGLYRLLLHASRTYVKQTEMTCSTIVNLIKSIIKTDPQFMICLSRPGSHGQYGWQILGVNFTRSKWGSIWMADFGHESGPIPWSVKPGVFVLENNILWYFALFLSISL